MRRQTWLVDDVAHCSTLYDVSPKMYRLLYRNKFPLPAVQSWAQKMKKKKIKNSFVPECMYLIIRSLNPEMIEKVTNRKRKWHKTLN